MTDSPSATEPPALKITPGRTLARNSILNLAATGWNLALILVVMPRLVHRLGTDAYGLFALAWALIGYLNFFDIGVSQAAVKYIAQALARRDMAHARSIFRASLLLNVLLGSVGCAAVIAVTPLLVERAFHVPPALQSDARIIFYAVGIALPFLIGLGTMRSTLAAAQRFGWMNSVNAVTSTLTWILAWVLATRGVHVVPIIITVLGVRAGTLFAYALVIDRLLPGVLGIGGGKQVIVELLTFGGWVTVWQLISPLLFYVDRFLIASMISLAAVTYYSVPFEGVTRMSILPASLAATLFPAFSERSLHDKPGPLHVLYWHTIKYLLTAMVPGVLLLLLFGRDVLAFWVGPDFAVRATVVLYILALGTLMNGIGYFPAIALQSIGRPDVTTKLLMLETPIYLGMCYWLIPRYGIAGAAAAFTARTALDTLLLLISAWKLMRLSSRSLWESGLAKTAALAVLAAAGSWIIYAMSRTLAVRLVASAAMMGTYLIVTWFVALDRREHDLLLNTVRLRRKS